jgi:hypothetical protein
MGSSFWILGVVGIALSAGGSALAFVAGNAWTSGMSAGCALSGVIVLTLAALLVLGE